jgi:hypothetical protein
LRRPLKRTRFLPLLRSGTAVPGFLMPPLRG